MIQDQLVDYINAQTKLGVSRDTIKATLVGAGWQAADVEDTLKKVESAKPAQPAAGASASIATISAAGPAISSPAASSSSASGPQMIKVSDLVSASESSATMSVKPTSSSSTASTGVGSSPMKDTASRSPLTGPSMASTKTTIVSSSAKPGSFSSNEYPAKAHSSRGALITEIVLGVVILVVAGFAGFLYMQNNSLSAKITSLQTESTGVSSQVSTLQAQITASTTAYAAQVASLTNEDQELQNELSFYAAPINSTAGASTTVTISGTVSGGGKGLYIITATYGAKIYVENSKDASVTAALAPLVGASSATQFSGTYIPGSDSITLSTANGAAVQ